MWTSIVKYVYVIGVSWYVYIAVFQNSKICNAGIYKMWISLMKRSFGECREKAEWRMYRFELNSRVCQAREKGKFWRESKWMKWSSEKLWMAAVVKLQNKGTWDIWNECTLFFFVTSKQDKAIDKIHVLKWLSDFVCDWRDDDDHVDDEVTSILSFMFQPSPPNQQSSLLLDISMHLSLFNRLEPFWIALFY